MPILLGKYFTIRVFVDADHAGDSVTRRSRTGFVVFLNIALIYWLSKKQTSCEMTTFGSELCAMKHATKYVRELWYKLHLFGTPTHEPAFIFGDNQSVLCNTSLPGSMIKKKYNSNEHHFVWEGCTKYEWYTAYWSTHMNVEDLMTKPLAGEKRFVWLLLYHVYD